MRLLQHGSQHKYRIVSQAECMINLNEGEACFQLRPIYTRFLLKGRVWSQAPIWTWRRR